jgi:signal transduction histidine kinase
MWFDATGSANWQQARAHDLTAVEGNINLGYKPGVLWVRMQVQRGDIPGGQQSPPEWWLEVSPASLDEVTLWVEPSTSADRLSPVDEPLPQQAGATVHPDLRPLWHRNSVFLVNMPVAGTYTLWLRVKTDSVQAVTPVLWQINALEKNTQFKTMVAGLFYGILICITLTALTSGIAVGTPIFLMCAGYFFLLGLYLFVADGWLGLLLLPGRPALADMLSSACVALLTPLFATVFSRLLRVHQTMPLLVRWYLRTIWSVGGLAVVMLMSPYFALVAPVMNSLAMLQMSLIFGLALWVLWREPSLRWVLLALITILPLGVLRLARNEGFDFFINYLDAWLMAGITLHGMILLFFVTRIVGQTYKSNLNTQAQLITGAEQLDEQRDFVALLSHEFRNPISVLDGALSNLHRQPFDADTTARVGRMARAVERLKYVLGYCLADERLASLEAAQCPRFLLAPSDILEEGLQQLDDVSGRLQLLVADSASQALLGSARVMGDLPMLGAALKNLLDNALKYAGTGPVQLSVQAHSSQVTFTVRDQGQGLDEQAMSRLFEKFTRGQHHQYTPGAGLGLHLARKIVLQHGGAISIRNASGGGALAQLSLPLRSS